MQTYLEAAHQLHLLYATYEESPSEELLLQMGELTGNAPLHKVIEIVDNYREFHLKKSLH